MIRPHFVCLAMETWVAVRLFVATFGYIVCTNNAHYLVVVLKEKHSHEYHIIPNVRMEFGRVLRWSRVMKLWA